MFELSRLIQGGMGIGVSGWPLARAVASRGHLGVVSGTAIDAVLVRRLQDGDPAGELRRAMAHFPVSAIAEAVLERYFIPGGRDPKAPYRALTMHSHREQHAVQDLLVLASFVEVWLAREGHGGAVGINLLTKVQIPTVPSLFGAMLASVDCVLMGAGIPRDIPGILDTLADGRGVETQLELSGTGVAAPILRFDPTRFTTGDALVRPAFLAIVSSHVLATVLSRKATGTVDGFVVEAPSAGGHNAPPRGRPAVFDAIGQPIYGERDSVDLAALAALGLPFWLAGGVDTPELLRSAIEAGATGAQVGTLFAFCRESGMEPALRHQVIDLVRCGGVHVLTSSRASSTGYPFKVASVPGTLSEASVYAARERICDLGYLREAYVKPNGSIGYRCAAEPLDTYLAKGGSLEDTMGRTCLCNGLAATIGLGQVRPGGAIEPPIVTSGDGLAAIARVLGDREDYSAADVIAYLTAP